MCYYMSAHAFYSKKPPVLQTMGGFLFVINHNYFNNLILNKKHPLCCIDRRGCLIAYQLNF